MEEVAEVLLVGALGEVLDVKIIEFLLDCFPFFFFLVICDINFLAMNFFVVHLFNSFLSVLFLLVLDVREASA